MQRWSRRTTWVNPWHPPGRWCEPCGGRGPGGSLGTACSAGSGTHSPSAGLRIKIQKKNYAKCFLILKFQTQTTTILITFSTNHERICTSLNKVVREPLVSPDHAIYIFKQVKVKMTLDLVMSPWSMSNMKLHIVYLWFKFSCNKSESVDEEFEWCH